MGKRDFYKEEKMKKTIYIFSITLILSIVVFLTLFVMYNKKLKNDAEANFDNLGMIEEIVSNEDLEETSFSDDRGIKDFTNTANEVNSSKQEEKKKVNKVPVSSTVDNTTKKNSNEATDLNKNTAKNTSNSSVSNVSNSLINTVEGNSVLENSVKKELKFEAPVAGEIIKDFATDSLIYSNTLEEWTTHQGIDIKAEKTSVVKAAEGGIIESIKNDPRYGLTITIAHDDGFKTIYSNLLSTEFVKENEVVEKGQTIATVGESASFEVADEPHLHFEIYKNGESVNPTIYLQ